MSQSSPTIVILAGPNGSGKSTAAPALLRDYMGVNNFVNADTIAAGLSAFNSETVAIEASRIMLARLDELSAVSESFAFETTLASRTFAPWIRRQQYSGFIVQLLFLWLKSAEIAVERVKNRVRDGGHSVPPEVVRRRYQRGLSNLVQLYLPVVDEWTVFDASPTGTPMKVASGNQQSQTIHEKSLWQQFQECVGT